jgi:regulator of sigma E protease
MFLTIIIFIIILGILVFVHEFGHFVIAKKSGMQVEEFGFGFPPRLAGIQILKENKVIKSAKSEIVSVSETDIQSAQGEVIVERVTDTVSEFQEVAPKKKWHFVWGHKPPRDPNQTVYSVNWIPLGGFVKILGENNDNEDNPGSFINKGFWPRFFTLVAGVVMNVILAWVIFSAGYMVGLPVAINSLADVPAHATLTNPQTAVLDVVKNLPADKAGIKPNDIILSLDGNAFNSVDDFQQYIQKHKGQAITFQVQRGSEHLDIPITPDLNPAPGQGATGIEISLLGRLKYPWYLAIWQGVLATASGLVGIVYGLYSLFAQHIGFSSLGGPIQIARLTGQVTGLGFVFLMQFTAFLSLNLAVLNILPFPALDGGRVLFLIIEKIRRKRNNQKIEMVVNTAGFIFLILLMIAVTVHDIIRK